MSDTDTGNAMAIPPRDTWVETAAGLTRWRPVVTSVTVERADLPDKVFVLTVREGGDLRAEVRLSADEAAHVARLLFG